MRISILCLMIVTAGDGKEDVAEAIFEGDFVKRASRVAQQKKSHLQCRRHKRLRFNPWVWKILWRRAWQPTPVFLPRESQGQIHASDLKKKKKKTDEKCQIYRFERPSQSQVVKEKEMAAHSSVLAWRIPGTGSLVGCRLWGLTELDTTEAP